MGRIFICGDLHGSSGNIRAIMSQIDNPKEEDSIIVCGDAGFEYEEYIQGAAKKTAAKFPGSWIVIRGNHDSRYWKKHTNITDTNIPLEAYSGWYIEKENYLVQKKYPNIKYVRDDGGLYTIHGYNFLFVPGAYSVDKFYRLEFNKPWNQEEQLTLKEQLRLLDIVNNANKNNTAIDFVIGHTFPLRKEVWYKHLFLDFLDQSSVDKTMEKFLDILSTEFEKNPSFKHYFGGHFHSDIAMGDYYTMLYRVVENIEDYI